MSRLPTQPFQTCCCNDGQNRSSARRNGASYVRHVSLHALQGEEGSVNDCKASLNRLDSESLLPRVQSSFHGCLHLQLSECRRYGEAPAADGVGERGRAMPKKMPPPTLPSSMRKK